MLKAFEPGDSDSDGDDNDRSVACASKLNPSFPRNGKIYGWQQRLVKQVQYLP